jgi:hypothetical protein
MSTFKLKRFSHPDSLRAIAPERLIAFLRPFDVYLIARGFRFPSEQQQIDYDVLVRILMNPDENVPDKMVESLYVVHEMSDEDNMERLLDLSHQRNIDLGLDDGPTAADVAIAALLAAPELLWEVHAESQVSRARRFEYWAGSARRPCAFPYHDARTLKAMADRLDIWFKEKKKGEDTTEVLVFPHDRKVHILIRHGTAMARVGSIRKGVRSGEYFRPDVHDVLVYDTTMDLLGLKAGTKGEKDLYRTVFGSMLFGSETYFAKRFSLDLDPLRERGPDLLVVEDLPELAQVKLVEVRRSFGGETKARTIDQSTDLFRTYGDRWQHRLCIGKLVGATFALTLGEGRAKRVRRVAIEPLGVAKYDRDDADSDAIELWLRRCGIMPEPQDERDAPSTAPLLADAGRTAEADDRPTGVAATSG